VCFEEVEEEPLVSRGAASNEDEGAEEKEEVGRSRSNKRTTFAGPE
jgi:hypothetical protein